MLMLGSGMETVWVWLVWLSCCVLAVAGGSSKPNIIIFYVDDVSGAQSSVRQWYIIEYCVACR